MNNYLELVLKYARVHKQKNRLTIICITISVMLVTAIFGMADMSLKAQLSDSIRRYGNWHLSITDISDDVAKQIGERDDIAVADWLAMVKEITYDGKELVVQSSGQELAEQMNLKAGEGRYPSSIDEAILDKPGLERLGLSIGDTIDVSFDDKLTKQYKITGTFNDFSSLKGDDAHGLLITTESMFTLPAELYQRYFYIQFKDGVDIRGAIADIENKYGVSDEKIDTNIVLLGLMGQSDDTIMLEIYLTAGILFVLVLMAGVFMISSSFNMSIIERTKFFGLLRCLGATKKQIKHYIRVEGLLYCVKAVPLGIILGCIILWCAMFSLNKLNSQYLPEMPMFQISVPGILAGVAVGFLVVMIASSSPARQAAKVSPQAAVTGNVNHTNNQRIRKASNTKFLHVDTAMGIRHAFSNRKSMVMIAGSFAISIVLFLCFSVLISFMNYALSPLKEYSPDISIQGSNESVLLDHKLVENIKKLPHIQNVYGRMFQSDISANTKQDTGSVKLFSYDETQFAWAEQALIYGNIDNVKNGNGVMVDFGYAERSNWNIGDKIQLSINDKVREVEVAAIVSDVPIESASGEWIVGCSEETFTNLTGITAYKVIDVQTNQDTSKEIRKLIPQDAKLLDFQKQNSEVRTGFYAMAVFVYGFLIVIALVALFNIINTVNASVSGRMSNYGVMRAVGMSGKQLEKVVKAEAATYAISGCIVGGILGTILHRVFFDLLITSNWGQLWEVPGWVLVCTITIALLTTFAAVISPTKKIGEMSIVNVVNAV